MKTIKVFKDKNVWTLKTFIDCESVVSYGMKDVQQFKAVLLEAITAQKPDEVIFLNAKELFGNWQDDKIYWKFDKK